MNSDKWSIVMKELKNLKIKIEELEAGGGGDLDSKVDKEVSATKGGEVAKTNIDNDGQIPNLHGSFTNISGVEVTQGAIQMNASAPTISMGISSLYLPRGSEEGELTVSSRIEIHADTLVLNNHQRKIIVD